MRDFNQFSGRFSSDITVGGKLIPVESPVMSMRDHSLRFSVGRGARRRYPKQQIDLIVLHWTGGESTAKQTHRVLSGRDLGVEFAIDRQAIIWQFADPVTIDTFDAGPVNRRSVGIEITNYGFRRSRNKVPTKGRIRPKYSTRLNGRRRVFASYFPAQVRAALALCDSLRNALPDISHRIPRDGGGELIQRVLKRDERDRFSGVLGHFHVSMSKSDPGMDIFKSFDLAGY